MRKLSLLFLLFLSKSFSQQQYDYFGALKLNGDDKTLISYRLVFAENNGDIKGYSVTDLGGLHETKNTIVGHYDADSRKLSFNETSILYTKSQLSKDIFCFVNYSGKVKLNENTLKIVGDFKGLFKNATKCIDGTITMVSSTKVYKSLNKINDKIQKSKKVDEKTKLKVNPIKILDSLKVNNLGKNQNLNLFVNSNSIQIEIWDAQREDGDRIDLFHNGLKIVNDFTVLNKKKIINVKLDSDKNVFRIEALNEGDSGLNTAMIKLIDNDRHFELTTNLKKGEKTSITIVKE